MWLVEISNFGLFTDFSPNCWKMALLRDAVSLMAVVGGRPHSPGFVFFGLEGNPIC